MKHEIDSAVMCCKHCGKSKQLLLMLGELHGDCVPKLSVPAKVCEPKIAEKPIDLDEAWKAVQDYGRGA